MFLGVVLASGSSQYPYFPTCSTSGNAKAVHKTLKDAKEAIERLLCTNSHTFKCGYTALVFDLDSNELVAKAVQEPVPVAKWTS